jgi:hypothetical protein
MNVEITTIPDVTKHNVNEAKMVLAENIIKNVYPLFDDIYKDKIDKRNNLRIEVIRRDKILKNKREKIQKMLVEYERKKKIAKLLSRIEKLVDSGLVYDGGLKNQTVILLKIVEKLPEEKINEHMAETMRIIQKRFSKI